MTRSPRQRSLLVSGILIALVPFAFGVLRALETGSDFRFLWTALGSSLGAILVMTLGKARSRSRHALFSLSIVALVMATLLAALAALLLGARSAPAIWVVAFGFGLCSAVGGALLTFSQGGSHARRHDVEP